MKSQVFVRIIGILPSLMSSFTPCMLHHRYRERVCVYRITIGNRAFIYVWVSDVRILDIMTHAEPITYSHKPTYIGQVTTYFIYIYLTIKRNITNVKLTTIVGQIQLPVTIEVTKENGAFQCIVFPLFTWSMFKYKSISCGTQPANYGVYMFTSENLPLIFCFANHHISKAIVIHIPCHQ